MMGSREADAEGDLDETIVRQQDNTAPLHDLLRGS